MIVAIVGESSFRSDIEEKIRNESADGLILTDGENLQLVFQDKIPEALFLEIGGSTWDSSELIQKLKRNPMTQKIPIVAFGNSLRADLLQDAREAGADLVLPKAAFREKLPELIRHYAKPSQKGNRGKQ